MLLYWQNQMVTVQPFQSGIRAVVSTKMNLTSKIEEDVFFKIPAGKKGLLLLMSNLFCSNEGDSATHSLFGNPPRFNARTWCSWFMHNHS